MAQTIARYLIPGFLPYLISDCMKRYMQGQALSKPGMYSTMFGLPVNIFLQWLLVWSPFSIGYVGAPIASSITNILIAAFLVVYISKSQARKYWGGWKIEHAFDRKELKKFIKLGIPGMIMLCAEWWAFEVVSLAAGLLGETFLAAQAVMFNTSAIAYMFPLGVSVAASTRVGNAMGDGSPVKARNTAYTSIIIGLIIGFGNSLVLYAAKERWGYIFSDNKELVAIVAELLPLLAFFQLSDAANATGRGVLVGCGRQAIGAILNTLGYLS
jgi:MATE family multidrug resistance protein